MIKDFIENHSVFTRRELMERCGDTQNNANLLSRAKKEGKVVSIARGVYASNTGRFRANEANPYAVANKLGGDVVFAYGSALALLTGSHDITFVVSFYCNGHEAHIKWNGHEYISYRMPRHLLKRERELPDGTLVCFTDKEQTILDCLARPDRCGGPEALIRSLATIRFVDAEKLVQGAAERSKSVSAKLGWILSSKKEEWNIPDEALQGLKREVAGKGPFYFGRSHNVLGGSWCSEWRLYLPAPLEECVKWTEG